MNNHETIHRAIVLDVPYAEKEQAKQLGAKWDPDIRKWFVPSGIDPKPLARWFPKGNHGDGTTAQ